MTQANYIFLLLLDLALTVAIVTYMLMGMGSDIKDAGFPAVGISNEGHVDGLDPMIGNVTQGTIGFFNAREVVMVDNFLFGFLHRDDFNLAGIGTTQRDLKIHNAVFDGVFQRGIQYGMHLHSLDETHLNNALAEGSMTRHTHHHPFFARL